MKGTKRIVALAMAGAMVLGMNMVAFAAPADSSVAKRPTSQEQPVKPEKVKVAKVAVSASGNLNVSFRQKIEWDKDAQIQVADEEGNAVKATLRRKTGTGAFVRTEGMVKGKKYTLTITGVKVKGAETFTTATFTFTAKGIKTEASADKVTVKDKKNVIVNFKSSVQYKDEAVEVKDADGNTYEAKIVKKSRGSVAINVKGLVKGKKYVATVTGVKLKKEANFGSVSKSFIAK